MGNEQEFKLSEKKRSLALSQLLAASEKEL